MLHLHLIGLLTFEFLTLIAAFFLLIYVNKQQLDKWYRHFSKALVIALHIIIVATFIHGFVHHFQTGHLENLHHQELFEQHMNH
ncbi:MAG: hypothetical protein A2X08_09800 [Bacteroidetes bacterium GWA2_32_17]|nr:MAG: hypothetical protein A2X08_09800 [Bacteroidetes bacterium GWA2_32_17]